MKNAVFIENEAHLLRIALISGVSKENTLCISCDETLVKQLKKMGWRSAWLESFLLPGDEKCIEKTTWQSSLDWHRLSECSSAFTYRGINLGELTVFPFNCALYWIYKNWVGMRRFLTMHSFDRLICFRDLSSQVPPDIKPTTGELIFPDILSAMKLDIEWVDASAPIRDALTEHPIRFLLKKIVREVLSFLDELTIRRWQSFRSWQENKRSPHILFCSALPYVTPLIRKLKNKSRISYLGEDFRLAKLPYLRAQRIPHFTFDLYRKFLSLFASESRLFCKNLEEAKPKVYRHLKDAGVFSINNDNLFDAVRGRLNYLTEHEFKKFIEYIDVFYYLLKTKRVDIVVVDEDSASFRRTLVTVGQKLNIPSSVICHVSSPSIRGHEVHPLAASAIMVGGPFIKENFLAVGIPARQILVTGVPRYDEISSLDKEKCQEEIYKRFQLKKDQRLVTLASSCTRYPRNRGRAWKDIDRGIRDVLEYFVHDPETAVVIKIHPRDHYDEALTWEIVRQVRPENTFVIRNLNTLALLAASRLVLTYFSSCIVEACALAKSTVVLNYFEEGVLLPPQAQSSPFVVQQKEQLCQILDALWKDDEPTVERAKQFRKVIAEGLLASMDGNAAERMSETLLKMACRV